MAQHTGRVGSSPRERGIQRHYVRLPGLTVGRCWPRKFCATIHSGFQSAPGLTVGRCAKALDISLHGCVSIRARPPGRAMPHPGTRPNEYRQFQSAPGLTVGRCHNATTCALRFKPVSIRARPHGRAMRRRDRCRRSRPRFNPRPASRSGDAGAEHRRACGAGRFNPRPASRSGDAPGLTTASAATGGFNPRPASRSGDACMWVSGLSYCRVSIRARPHGRAMQYHPTLQHSPGRGFNPRPASRSGDAAGRARRAVLAAVSIRARPHGRAMLARNPELAQVFDVSIRARPHGRAMRVAGAARGIQAGVSIRARPHGRAMLSSTRREKTLHTFQSAPGLTVGRCSTFGGFGEPRTGFNPRPASRSGDARSTPTVQEAALSFNPRPASRSGDATGLMRASPALLVSIRARPHGRAMPSHVRGGDTVYWFQSAPGLTVGRCFELLCEHCIGDPVSIRARPHGRAMLRRSASGVRSR